jgi:hypothetical protein
MTAATAVNGGATTITKDLKARTARYFTPEPNKATRGAIVLFEVPHGEQGRRTDALVVNLYTAKPRIVGIEFKASRADWLTELRSPAKADAWIPHCDEWWLAAPEGIVDLDSNELPAGWGLLVPYKKVQMRAVVPAARKTVPAVPMWLLHEIAKKCDTMRLEELWQQHLKDAAEGEKARREAQQETQLDRVGEAALEDSRVLNDLIAASGLTRDRWLLMHRGRDSEPGRALLLAVGEYADRLTKIRNTDAEIGRIRAQLERALVDLDRPKRGYPGEPF